ncbi:hypothetical protein HJ033_23355 [Vibrio parahaemolyticus]|nr:hypothetical protein [Vibrio parahaemolyticus]MBM4851083.1 hypothetical protein [Vibrio parahaemolyticus]HBC3436535.1 hypothetical protein [Vibrio parahaemolyticus]HBH7866805.1 hypothetical protein [Vibrio parahaemolyticus]
MNETQELILKMKKGLEFAQGCLIPAYQEIAYITTNTEILFEDANENLRILNKVMKKSAKKRDVVSRNTIRSSCACVDGFSHILKCALQRTLDRTENELFSSKQLNFINGTFTNGSGADNYKDSLKCFAKKYGVDVSGVFGTGEFQKLKKVFEIRNRLMHPKNGNDFHITREETILLSEAIVWFIESHHMVFKQVLDHIEKKADEVLVA